MISRFTSECLGLVLGAGMMCTALSAAPPAGRFDRDSMGQVVRAVYQSHSREAASAKPTYLGSEVCIACHQDKATYRETLHAKGLKHAYNDTHSMVVKDGIIADYDGNGVDDFRQGLDFNQINSAFNKYKPNAPILGYTPGKGYTVTIAGVEFLVGFVHGGTGDYKQRYVLRFPVTDTATGYSADFYYSPVQFNETSKSYVLYSDNYWWNADLTPKIKGPMTAAVAAKTGKSFNVGCVGCHSTVFSVKQDVNGEWVSTTARPIYVKDGDNHYLDLTDAGEPGMLNIGCERCHGAGLKHVINYGNKKFIVKPEKDFTAKQQNELCGSCHSRGTSMNGKHEYPLSADGKDFGEDMGGDLYGKYWIDKPGLWPDGKTSKQHHQQLQDMMKSSKWEYQFHKVTCSECHDVHVATKKHIRTSMTVTEGGATLKIATATNDNTLCLACHAGFGPFAQLKRAMIVDPVANSELIESVVTAHTRHRYAPTGEVGLSRCTECHMAKMASSGDAYDMHSHTFEVVPAEKTLLYQDKGGMPNSCAVRCHRGIAQLFGQPADTSLTNWTEASDVAVANWLKTYYGKDGIWWKTK